MNTPPWTRLFLGLFCFLLLWAGPVQAAGEPPSTTLPFDVFYEDGSRLDVATVAAPAMAARFRPATLADVGLGYTARTIWLRLRLHNPGSVPLARYLELGPPRLQDVRFYQPSAEGGWSELRSGLAVPVAERVLPSRQTLFPVLLAPGEQRLVYARISSHNAIMLKNRLWEPLGFHQAERRVDLINGIQFGALFLFVLYALTLFASTRDPAFFYFSLMVASVGMNDVSIFQYGYEFLWPGAADWNLRTPGVFVALAMFASSQLIRRLLLTRQQFPRWDRSLFLLASALLLSVPALLLFDYLRVVQVVNWLSVLAILLGFTVTVHAIVRGVRGARLLLLAFLLSWVTGLMRLGQILKLVPPDFFSDFSLNLSMILSGMITVVVMLQKVGQLQKERESAQQQALRAGIEARLQVERDVQRRTDELRLAKEVAEETSRAKSTFLAHLSHELRTPLHSILGYSSLILDASASSMERRRIEAVQRSGWHLLALIDELMDYARGEAGRLQLDPRPTYLRALLETVTDEAEVLARDRSVILGTVLPPELPPVVCVDGVRLRQVLSNLISNACRHSGGSRVTLEVDVEGGQDPEAPVRLWFGVRDNGVGIAPRDRERIFHPFEQARDDHRERAGMGLGLAIARQLVTLMGGELVCQAPALGGSLFRFSIQVVREQEQPLPLTLSRSLRRYAGPTRRLLVVDDMTENCQLLADILAAAGFEAVLAESGEKALDLLGAQDFDLVITDQLMPDMDGWELLRRARAAGRGQPFVLLSAAAPLPPTEWPLQLGFAASLLKPCPPDRLLDVLGQQLGLLWEELPVPPEAELQDGGELPDLVELAWLRSAVADGRITDIEDWVDRMLRERPETGRLVLAVRESLRRMDLAGIDSLIPA